MFLNRISPKVCSSEVETEEFTLLLAVGELPHVGGEALHGGRGVLGLAQPFLKEEKKKKINSIELLANNL